MKTAKIKPIENPKENKEYWVVVNCLEDMPYYFTSEERAKAYAKQEKLKDYVIYQECFN